MNPEWRKFLEQSGAEISNDLHVSFNHEGRSSPDNYLTDLSLLSPLEITGVDAGEFLHGQFSSDLKKLTVDTFQYSAWCNPQGRVIALFMIYRKEQAFYLLVPSDIKDRFLKRLRMYVLRSNVVITDRSGELVCLGITGDESVQHLSTVPELPGKTAREGELTLLRIDDGPPLRLLVTGPVHAMKALWQSLAMQFTGADNSLWQFRDISAGIPWIQEPTSELFLPQELDLDITGGLSYVKGCFPGQEIIARVHYRGSVKQRLHRSFIPAGGQQPVPGDKLYAGDSSDNNVGTILNVVDSPANGYGILAVADVKDAAAWELRLAGNSGKTLLFEAVHPSIGK